MHAAGVVIADKPLWEYVPVCTRHRAARSRHPVRHGRGRDGRPGEVRLPRPEDAHRHRRRGASSINAQPRRTSELDIDTHPAGRPGGLRAHLRAATPTGVFQLESQRLHARCCKSCKPDRFEDIIAAGALYRPGPARRAAWSTMYIERKHGRGEGRIPAPAARADPQGDLRRHRLPGAGDADRPGPGRLHPGRGRPAPPRHGQEEGRGDGQGARSFIEGALPRTACAEQRRRRDLRPDGEVRRLRLQQVALRRLRR